MEIKNIFAILLLAASLSFAYPPGQPGDHTCTKDLESMVNYCEDYCTKMAGNGGICMLCSTSVSERGVIDACSCQNSKREHLNFYNISCDIPVSEQTIPQTNKPNATEDETGGFVTAINRTNNTAPAVQNITQNKTTNTTIIAKKNDTISPPSSSQDSGSTACMGPAAIAFIVSLAILGRKRA